MDERRHLSEHGVSKTVKQIKCNQKFKLKYSAEILLSTYTSKTWLKITCFHVYSANPVRDVKFVFFPNSNFVFKIRILFELRSGPK